MRKLLSFAIASLLLATLVGPALANSALPISATAQKRLQTRVLKMTGLENLKLKEILAVHGGVGTRAQFVKRIDDHYFGRVTVKRFTINRGKNGQDYVRVPKTIRDRWGQKVQNLEVDGYIIGSPER